MFESLPAVEYLLKDGLSQTWVVGHNLVTITTSGCPTAPIRNGLCDRCSHIGKQPISNSSLVASKSDSSSTAPLSPETNNTQSSVTPLATERRYTKASLQYSSGNESAGSTDLTSSSSSTSGAISSNIALTQRQISNSSTASLEALSRRGSNPEPTEGVAGAVIGSTTSLLGGHSLSTTSISASPTQLQSVQQQLCIRSCTGWAEILIRRPTGNISWITRIQNPIANDCFGHDLPFSNIVSLFLPTSHGGVFGPDFAQSTLMPEPQPEIGKSVVGGISNASTINTSADNDGPVQSMVSAPIMADEQKTAGAITKVRALQRQEEISSSTTVPPLGSSLSTAAIDIPKPLTSKRIGGKEALADSVSDGEADDDTRQFADALSRARNPVRRVNSSPEMSSSWRQTFLAAKPAPLSGESAKIKASKYSASLQGLEEAHSQQQQQQIQLQQQKKKSVQYTKDMRVSCEAIPEEIAGSTPPQVQAADTLAVATSGVTASELLPTFSASSVATAAQNPMTNSTAIIALPPKQHSADDVSISASMPVTSVQQSTSSSSLKLNVDVEKIMTKPPHSPVAVPPPQSPRLDKQPPNSGQKTTTFTTNTPTSHQGLAKSSSSGGGNANLTSASSYLGGGPNDYGNNSNNNGDMMRVRSKTISVVREVNGRSRPAASNFRSFNNTSKPSVNAKLCMNPSFLFMQLYHTGQLQVTDVPIKVPPEETNVLTVLDLAPPFETHKIGVLYVGQGQCNNVVEILRNSHGSMRYVEFLSNIGTLVSLKEAERNNLFVNLDRGGADGKFTYVWKDDIVQVNFIKQCCNYVTRLCVSNRIFVLLR